MYCSLFHRMTTYHIVTLLLDGTNWKVCATEGDAVLSELRITQITKRQLNASGFANDYA